VAAMFTTLLESCRLEGVDGQARRLEATRRALKHRTAVSLPEGFAKERPAAGAAAARPVESGWRRVGVNAAEMRRSVLGFAARRCRASTVPQSAPARVAPACAPSCEPHTLGVTLRQERRCRPTRPPTPTSWR